MNDQLLERTRLALHGVAELVMAGPQYKQSGTIRLAVVDDGLSTVSAPDMTIDGAVLRVGQREIALNGLSIGAVAEAAGVEPTELTELYSGGSGLSANDPAEADPELGRYLCDAFRAGRDALVEFAPQQTPTVWPEHFDVSITVDEVNYGVSPGDGYEARPYAYVGPFAPRQGEFWNAPFGAARTLEQLGGAAQIAAFFREGAALAVPS